jgi:iron-only hydrogenase group A
MQEKIAKIKIDNTDYKVPEGITVLEACRSLNIEIPALCYLKDISNVASCSLCLVEISGARTLLRSCVTKVKDGMKVSTNNQRVRNARLTNMELLLASHPAECLTCDRNQDCDLRRMAYDMGVRDIRFDKVIEHKFDKDTTSSAIVRDPDKCVLCRRCVEVCANMQNVNAIEVVNRGKQSRVSTFFEEGLGKVDCVNCGQCIMVCPTGAIVEKDSTKEVWAALHDPEKVVLVEVAPAVRAALGEEFGMPAGTLVTGKIPSALRRIGFSKIFDTQFSADLTIMEEGSELIHRLKTGGKLPLITSCSPGWIKFAEHFFPEVFGNISTCKSPQQMFGAVAKTYYAEKMKMDPRNIVVVSVMPCTAKKFEAKRPEFDSAFNYWKDKMSLKDSDIFPDVDHVLTTRELARMIKESGINFNKLADSQFDNPLGVSTGAAVIFGATGGVMEAALRTAYELISGETLPSVDFEAVRGFEGIKTAEVDIKGKKVKAAVAHTLSNAKILLEEVAKGTSPYAFIEIMTCPGGCLGGGGQPIPTNDEIRQKRAEAIYKEDKNKTLRKSHDNPAVKAIYADFLKEPLGHLSHELLHTEYTARKNLVK